MRNRETERLLLHVIYTNLQACALTLIRFSMDSYSMMRIPSKTVMTPRMKFLVRHFTLFLVILYLGLASVSTYCTVNHFYPHAASHQHKNTSHSHSPLCFWACQVSAQPSNTQPASPQLLLVLFIVGVLVAPFLFYPILSPNFFRARPPPLDF